MCAGFILALNADGFGQTLLNYRAELSYAEGSMWNLSTSAGLLAPRATTSRAHWDLMLNVEAKTLTYQNFTIENEFILEATNLYYTSILSPPTQIKQTLNLHIDISHPNTSWTVPVTPGANGIIVPGISSSYGMISSTVHIYGTYVFEGPTETKTGDFHHTILFTGYQRYPDGGVFTMEGGVPSFHTFNFHGFLEFFRPNVGGPWISDVVDGVTITYGANGADYVTNGGFSNMAQYLTVSTIPEPSAYGLAVGGLALGLLVMRRRRQLRV